MSRIAGLVVLAVLMALVAAFPAGAQVERRRRHRPRRAGAAPPPASTRSRRRRRSTSCAPAATPSTPRSPRPACSASSSRSRAASAAAASWSSTTPSAAGSTRSTRARPRPLPLQPDAFLEPDASRARSPRRASSGLSVGVPGTVRGLGDRAQPLRHALAALAAAPRRADRPRGVRRRRDLRRQVDDNADIFDDFTATRELYLPGGAPRRRSARSSATRTWPRPTSASARTRTASTAAPIARDIAQTVQHPPEAPDSDRRTSAPGRDDPAATSSATRRSAATRRRSSYRGLDVFGMGPPSSGGSTVGEALNILEGFPPLRRPATRRCTATSRRRSSPTPTATSTSATRPSTTTCRCAACSRTGSRAERRALIGDDARCRRRSRPAIPTGTSSGHGHGKPQAGSDEKASRRRT